MVQHHPACLEGAGVRREGDVEEGPGDEALDPLQVGVAQGQELRAAVGTTQRQLREGGREGGTREVQEGGGVGGEAEGK